MRKKILIITTGGTLASSKGKEGLEPELDSQGIFANMEGITNYFDVGFLDLFSLDSSNTQPEEWQQLARAIFERYRDYDGIVVIHGTDTMAYTASALSFMLPGIPIPVVLTGSQLSILNPIADAVENCRCAVNMAGSGIPGVFVAFNRKVMRGTRASKVRTISFDAFESINEPYAGVVNSNGLDLSRYIQPQKYAAPMLKEQLCKDVLLLKLIPGTNPELFEMLLGMGYRGIYIEAFGIGGMHFERRNLPAAIEKAIEGGMTVLVGSQCLHDGSNLSVYQSGQKILQKGVLQARDMTAEAAVTKLMWVLGQTKDPEEIKRYFDTSLAGEVNLPGEKHKQYF